MSSRTWPRLTIESLIASGAIVAHKDGNYGSLYPRTEEFGAMGVPFLTAKSLDGGKIDIEGAPKLADARADAFRFGFVRPDDVLLSHNATIGRVAIVPQFDGRMLVGTSLTYFRLNRQSILPRYFAAYLAGADFQNQLTAVMSHSTRNQVPITAQRTLSIVVPPLDVQNMIASTLGPLDEKIKQNQRTTRALEELARATFKAWFVDFEPVKAKAAGQTNFHGIPPTAFAALPNRLADTSMGVVPEGWAVKRLDEVLTLHYGKSLPKTKRQPGSVPVYGSGGIDGTHCDALVHGPGIIVGRKGSVGTLYWEDADFFPIDTTYYVQAKGYASLPYLYELLQTQGLETMNTDAAVPGLNRENVYRLEVVMPSPVALLGFNEFSGPIRDMLRHLTTESSKLATVRDYILPRLLSGQVRVHTPQAGVPT